MSISADTIKNFLKEAGDRLTGSWVIIGGAVLHLVNIEERQTEDIDLAGPLGSTQSDIMILMEIAEALALPVESINQAGAFFLRKIPNWQNKLIEVHKGKRAVISRPNLELFFELKLPRFSEADLADCLNYLKYTVEHNEPLDAKKLIKLCESHLHDTAKMQRINLLIKEVSVNII